MSEKKKRMAGARVFYTLVLTQTLSLIGSQISGLAIAIWIFNETGDVTPLALVAFFSFLPRAITAGISGVLADRWDRRYVMAIADLGQAIGTVFLLISFASNSFELWHLYLVSVINASFAVFQDPAFSASITMLIPDEQRDRANAIRQITGPAAGIIAPVVAGLVFTFVGVEGAIILDLVTFLIAMGVVLSVSIPMPEETEEGKALRGSIWKESLGGFTFLWSRRMLFILTLNFTLINFLVSGLSALLAPYLLARTGDEATMGLMISLVSAGGLVGGVIMSIWGGTRPRIHGIMLGAIVLGIFVVFLGMAQTSLALMITSFILLIPTAVLNVSVASLFQQKIPADIQGRVFAVTQQMSLLLTPVAFLLIGPLTDQVFEPAVGMAVWEPFAPIFGNTFGSGMGALMAIGGGLSIIVAGVIYAVPGIRSLEVDLPDYVAVPAASPEAEDETVGDAIVEVATD